MKKQLNESRNTCKQLDEELKQIQDDHNSS